MRKCVCVCVRDVCNVCVCMCVVPQGDIKGIYGWESSLRQKPEARTVFHAGAGAGAWAKPQVLDNDSKKDQESEAATVGTVRAPTCDGWWAEIPEDRLIVMATVSNTWINSIPTIIMSPSSYIFAHQPVGEPLWRMGQ